MDKPTPSMRDLARRLLAVEAASQSASGAHVHEAVRVCDKLQISLTRFAGADGFKSLMRRALTLAQAEVSLVHSIKVKADGSMEGLEELATDALTSGNAGGPVAIAAIAILSNLLGLLFIFIGEPLALSLLREAWPYASFDEEHSGIEAKS